ncbi:MAG: hypothetical protein QF824_03635 [Candidatus Woesearchaeota archaeon]|jgi:hypothetical protein|nr:hypothetical protein [Candidatus Woesearchaeota archaeon]MDP7457223.1 hypothetical protein [Candidatus Woesearchaeota archaeon]|tara:strand:- start:300 stop:572 length:273 start_codon:yes stop_codon:yes gene_type:complete
MLKTIKVSEKAYADARKLQKALEKDELIEGVYDVKLSTAINYAIKTALETIRKRKKFLSAAGGWADMDKNIVKEIYSSRSKGTRWDIELD